MSSKELRHCPCCGGKPRRLSAKYNTLGAYGTKYTEKKWFAVKCTICGLTQPKRHYFSQIDSDNAWNQRVN